MSRRHNEGAVLLTTFHSPKSRSGSIVWLLEELVVPYETKVAAIRGADGGETL
jgi:glutathione S-transferase